MNNVAHKVSVSSNKLLMISGTGWLFDAMDIGLLSFILAALKQDWNLSIEQLGVIASINSLGMMIGAFLFGVYADKKGRKSAFILTLLLFSIASGLSAFAYSLTVILILRFFIGVGLGGELPVASTLVSESVSAAQRGRIIVILESFWAIGWLLAALIAYFLIPISWINWRGAMLLCAIPAFYCLYLRRNLPDSPLFYQKSKSLSIIQRIISLWQPEFRNTTIMLWILWFCVVFSYYGMFLWLPSVMVMKGFDMIKSFGYVLLMTIAQLPGYASVAWLIDKIGRKKVLVIYLMGTLISAYFFGQANEIGQLLLYGSLLSFFNLGVWGALYAYTAEQYNTAFRGTGSGMAAAVGRIGGIFGPMLISILKINNYSIATTFTIFSLSIFIAILAVVILGKETKQTVLY